MLSKAPVGIPQKTLDFLFGSRNLHYQFAYEQHIFKAILFTFLLFNGNTSDD